MQEMYDSERCDCTILHEEAVNRVKEKMPDDKYLYGLAENFKVFGDTTRIKILWALEISDMCVCDIAALLNMNQSAISHQLRILKQAALVSSRRDGKAVYYSLNDSHVKQILDLGMTHINERQL